MVSSVLAQAGTPSVVGPTTAYQGTKCGGTPVVTQNVASGVYYCRMRAGSVQKLAPVYLKR